MLEVGKTGLFASATILCLVLGGCSSLDRGAAKTLADAGAKTTMALMQESASARVDFVRNDDRDDLLAYLDRLAAPNASVTSIEKPLDLSRPGRRAELSTVLLKREVMLKTLVRTYEEFGQLASADPGAAIRTQVGELIESANGLITAVNALPVPGAGLVTSIPKQVAVVAGEGLALLAEEHQRREIRRASEQIRTVLGPVADALLREKAYAVSIRTDVVRVKVLLASALRDIGIADFGETAAELTELAGAKPAKDPTAALAGTGEAKQKQRAAIAGFLKHRALNEQQRIEEAYGASIATLRALIKEHQNLEEEKAIDLATIQLWKARLEDILSRMTSKSAGA